MTNDDLIVTEDRRFCPICGHEGNDLMCPICDEKTQSLAEETARIAKVEDEKSDLFDDVSLEGEQEKEQKEANEPEEDPTT